MSDAAALLLSDIYPTARFGAKLAEIRAGDTVAILGAGPVGRAAIARARMEGAGRIVVVDGIHDRLELARDQHAEVVDFNAEDPVQAVLEMTGGIGVDRVIDAVGVDDERPARGPAAEAPAEKTEEFDRERDEVAPEQHPDGDTRVPGNAPSPAPSPASRRAVRMVAKAGTIGIIGVYPPQVEHYPFGEAFMKNLTLKTGNCHHRHHIPDLVSMVAGGTLDPAPLITRWEGMSDAIEAYRAFDRREEGWTKVALGDGAHAHGLPTVGAGGPR
ncbi:zinc-binding dehydrogenase [Streptomyces sp. ST2-7A]|uniref:zinc-binding dehydrogenase n=1 Tax=Streptomyces sp. ST2-7A TaxID=2907214 RepID=UPI001F1B164A|nr:zinc-binding dehydrogenase [Streptomyces sp. ST2-7A]MCE7082441.1 zinc-binding dehydrogenase [Streptomyces sp. ST2-7A]